MTIEKLGARFEASAHKKHPSKGYTYVSIDLMIGRLNEVFGVDYSTEIINTTIGADFVMVQCRIGYTDSKGERRFKDGIGACPYPKKGMDIDDVCKTAYAEAIKKACNQLGIGLYLWDAEERKEVEQEMRAPKPTGGPAQNPPASVLTPSPITEKQLQQIGIECTRVFGPGPVGDTRARNLISEKVGRPIASRKELTQEEAAKLIKGLKATPDGKYATA